MESILVIPIVFLTVCLMLYILILLFERSMLINAADGAAITASAEWKETEGFPVGLGNVDLYWRMADAVGAAKQSAAAQNAAEGFYAVAAGGFTSVQGYAAYRGNLFNKSIEAGLKNTTEFPERRVTRQFGLSGSFKSDINARSVIPDFPEFIRSVDLVIGIEKELEEASPELKGFVESFGDAIGKIREFIGRLA